jgi:aldose 1-epimerase
MFSVSGKTENGFDTIILLDESTATSAAIIPSCGAILHSFSIKHNDGLLNVIDSYSSAADFKENSTAKGFKGCKLSPFVCRLKNGSYSFGKDTYRIKKFYLGNNAIHGLVYDAPFTIEEQFADETKAQVKVKYEYRATDAGYPFNYDCLITYQLQKENTLSITTEIVNKDKGIIPIADGWHPYFTFGGSINDLQLEFQSKNIIEFDEELIPTGNELPYETFGALSKIETTEFDNCFTLNFAECQPMCVIRDAQSKLQIEIHPDKNYPYLQIYTPPHRRSIAIENLSALPDAFNNGKGLLVLQTEQLASFTTTYKISLLT